MPKQGQRAEVNTFIQGLITEASPLNFPPNASKKEENFELFRDGTRKRRYGMDYEAGYVFRQTNTYGTINTVVPGFNTYVWEAVGGKTGRDFLVVQIGAVLYFYNLAVTPLSTGYIGLFDLGASGSSGGIGWSLGGKREVRYSFTAVSGQLVIASNTASIFVVKFDPNYTTPETAFNTSQVGIRVRDIWGVSTASALADSNPYYRPTSFDILHTYNLQNQSWSAARQGGAGSFVDPATAFFTTYNVYPANSEVVWTGLQFQPVVGTNPPFERLYFNLYAESFGSAAPAAKGHFVIDLLDRGQSRKAAYQDNYSYNNSYAPDPALMSVTKVDRTPDGASVTVKYAGRVFYAGFSGDVIEGDARGPTLNNYIFFTQLIKSGEEIGKCYSAGDPVSRDGSDIVDTDGGFVKIAEATTIYAMEVIGNDLIVLADNGVWAVSGGGDYGFTATNYKVAQLSSFGCLSPNSVILQGDAVLYWSQSGIFSVSRDKYNQLIATNITKATIQDLYDAIPLASKKLVTGTYDDTLKKARWVYKTGSLFTNTSATYELILDFDINNFCLNTIKNVPACSVEVIKPIYYKARIFYLAITNALVGNTYNFTFSEYRDTTFVDWKSVNGVGVDAKAFMLTGAQIAGDSAVYKQTPYLVMHFMKTEKITDTNGVPLNQSSCKFRTYWDWATNDNSNKVSELQEAYRYRMPYFANLPDQTYDNGFEMVTTKNKVRGRGRAFALYLETSPLKDCHVTGWNLTINGNAIA